MTFSGHNLQPTLESTLEQRLAARICVSAPYYALRGVRFDSDLHAFAAAETASAGEVGPMTCAEIGRHGAIAGLCAAALNRGDSRRYYHVAQKAECVFFPHAAPFGTPIALRAQPITLAARSAVVSVEARIEDQILAKMEVTYTVLREDLFTRLFSAHASANASVRGSYADYVPLRELGPGKASIDSVPVHACAGHFEKFPALPVAVLMGQLVRVARSEFPFERFRVTRANVAADSLAWAGEDVLLEAKPTKRSAEEWEFDCRANVGGRFIGGMTLGLAPL